MRSPRIACVVFPVLLTGQAAPIISIAQTQAAPLEFEVATIKPASDTNHLAGVAVTPGGRVEIDGVSLKVLIKIAFHLSLWQVSGGEPWMEKTNYDVVAKPPDTVPPADYDLGHSWYSMEDPRLRQMLGTLLIQRFQLKFHRSAAAGRVFLLEKSGRKLKLQPVQPPSPNDDESSHHSSLATIGGPGNWVISRMSMPQLANFGSDFVIHRPVSDRTGLRGTFNYLPPARDVTTPDLGDLEGSFRDMLDEIGLKLTPSRGPVESFIIDGAQPPSPN